jgi:hypothetical protein
MGSGRLRRLPAAYPRLPMLIRENEHASQALLQHGLGQHIVGSCLKVVVLIAQERIACQCRSVSHLTRGQRKDHLPVTPTTKSLLPADRNLATASSPDSTGIWLSKNTTANLLSGVHCPCIAPAPEWLSSDAAVLTGVGGASSDNGVGLGEPVISSSAASPFSAVVTLHPSRVSSRFMSIRVRLSSSTTRMGIWANGGGGAVAAAAAEGTRPMLKLRCPSRLDAEGGVAGIEDDEGVCTCAGLALARIAAGDATAGNMIWGGGGSLVDPVGVFDSPPDDLRDDGPSPSPPWPPSSSWCIKFKLTVSGPGLPAGSLMAILAMTGFAESMLELPRLAICPWWSMMECIVFGSIEPMLSAAAVAAAETGWRGGLRRVLDPPCAARLNSAREGSKSSGVSIFASLCRRSVPPTIAEPCSAFMSRCLTNNTLTFRTALQRNLDPERRPLARASTVHAEPSTGALNDLPYECQTQTSTLPSLLPSLLCLIKRSYKEP